MKIRKCSRAFALCFLLVSPVSAVTPPESVNHRTCRLTASSRAFHNPPAEARPFVRWWWNNNQVEEAEILRELDVLKAAGIGGVEINPIAGREKPEQSAAKVLTWRSPEWDRMLHVACKGARERGMIVDMIAGSGWPFGGKFLMPDEQIMRLSVKTDNHRGRPPEAAASRRTHRTASRRLRFVKVYPRPVCFAR